MKFQIFAVLLSLLLLLGCAGEQAPSSVANEKPSQSAPAASAVAQVQSEENQVFDCGTDKDCFYSKALGCAKTKVEPTETQEIAQYGMEISSTTYMETKGIDDGKCVFYLKMKNSVSYPPRLQKQLEASGEMSALLAMVRTGMEKQLTAVDGRYATCKYPVEEFNQILADIAKEGNSTLMSDDWENGECTGTFNDPLPS